MSETQKKAKQKVKSEDHKSPTTNKKPIYKFNSAENKVPAKATGFSTMRSFKVLLMSSAALSRRFFALFSFFASYELLLKFLRNGVFVQAKTRGSERCEIAKHV